MAELEYHVLPQGDAVAALNALRAAAGAADDPMEALNSSLRIERGLTQ